MSRLTNQSVAYIKNNKLEVAKKYALDNNVIVVLKGHNTIVVSNKGEVYISEHEMDIGICMEWDL